MGKLVVLVLGFVVLFNAQMAVAQGVPAPAVATPPIQNKALTPALTPIANYTHLNAANNSAVRNQVDQIIDAYNARFTVDGKLMAGDPRSGAFVVTQESLVSQLKNQNVVRSLMNINNNLVSAFNSQVYAIVDERQIPVALLFEYQKYDDNNRKDLRVRPFSTITNISTIEELNQTPSVAIRGSTADFSNGGEVQIICLTDLKAKKYSAVSIKISKDLAGAWGVFYQQARVTLVQLTLWFNLFTGNGGIQKVSINNSQQGIPLSSF